MISALGPRLLCGAGDSSNVAVGVFERLASREERMFESRGWRESAGAEALSCDGLDGNPSTECRMEGEPDGRTFDPRLLPQPVLLLHQDTVLVPSYPG